MLDRFAQDLALEEGLHGTLGSLEATPGAIETLFFLTSELGVVHVLLEGNAGVMELLEHPVGVGRRIQAIVDARIGGCADGGHWHSSHDG